MLGVILFVAGFVFLALLPRLVRYSPFHLPPYIDGLSAFQIVLGTVCVIGYAVVQPHTLSTALWLLPFIVFLIDRLFFLNRERQRHILSLKHQ